MPDLYFDHEVEIPCPQCGQEITQRVRALDAIPNVVCPACGASFHLDMTGFIKSGVDAEEKAIDDLP